MISARGRHIVMGENQHSKKEESQKLIKNGLCKLMEIMSYKDVTISALCLQAEVSRRTFYRNYNSLEEVVLQILDDKIRSFFYEVDAQICNGVSYSEIWEYGFLYWKKNDAFLTTLIHNGLI